MLGLAGRMVLQGQIIEQPPTLASVLSRIQPMRAPGGLPPPSLPQRLVM